MADDGKAPRWHVVAMLAAVLVTAIALGLGGVLAEENSARIVLGVMALVAFELRRGGGAGPPPATGAMLAALGAGELAAEVTRLAG